MADALFVSGLGLRSVPESRPGRLLLGQMIELGDRALVQLEARLGMTERVQALGQRLPGRLAGRPQPVLFVDQGVEVCAEASNRTLRHRLPSKRFNLLAFMRVGLGEVSRGVSGRVVDGPLGTPQLAFARVQRLERALFAEATQGQKLGQDGVGLH
jgi:hypothetical protein